VVGLRTSTARGRAMHYWTSMKAVTANAGASTGGERLVERDKKSSTQQENARESATKMKVTLDDWMRWRPPSREPK
jgi:hypothetical protein